MGSDYSNIPSSASEVPSSPVRSLVPLFCCFLVVARAPTRSASNLCNNGKLPPPNNYYFYYFYHHYQAFRRYTTIYSELPLDSRGTRKSFLVGMAGLIFAQPDRARNIILYCVPSKLVSSRKSLSFA